MADSFVPPPYTELAVALGMADATLPTDAAQLALERATGLIQSALDQRIVVATGTVLNLVARPNQWQIWLPERPVNAVTAVTVNGVAKVVDVDWYLDGNSIVTKNAPWGGWSGTAPVKVAITYNHGYAVIPQDLVAVCLSVAARLYQNPTQATQVSVGAVSEAYGGTSGGAGLTDLELSALGQYRLLAVA